MSRPVTAVVRDVLMSGPGMRDQVRPAEVRPVEFSPPDPGHFGVHAQVLIGEPDDTLVDSFDIVVCTPSWFAEQCTLADDWGMVNSPLWDFPAAVLPGAGVWFVRRWDAAEFETALRVVCASASGGPDWGTVASRIGRLIPWEYDLRHDARVDASTGEPA